VTPPEIADGETVSLDKTALAGGRPRNHEYRPLLRGDVSGPADNAVIEVPLPLAGVEDPDTVRVLHVDDEPEIGALLAQYLERLDDSFEVLVESTVPGALDALEREDVDCVVSDYEMPTTDGLEFLEMVRDRCPDLPFILYTGKGSEEVASEAIAAGVTDYMRKGTGTDTYEVLANRIRNAVEQYRVQRQFWNALSWYQRLVEQEITGVFILQGLEFVYVNRTLAETFGHSQSGLIGSSPLALVTDADHDEVMETLLEHTEGNADTFTCEFTGEYDDGSTVDVAVHCGAVEYDGDPAWIGVLDDVSERTDCR